MGSRESSTWREASDTPSRWVEFVVRLYDENFDVRFANQPDKLNAESLEIRRGLLVDLNGLTVILDPRTQQDPLPTVPGIAIEQSALIEALGEVPPHPGIYRVEISMMAEGIEWDDRIVILDGARVNPASVHHDLDQETFSFDLLDPLDVGKTYLPNKRIVASELPSGWQSFIINGANGRSFPICYGDIYRSAPIKVYDDGGDSEGDPSKPIRRYILCGHRVSGQNATIHRVNDEIRTQDGTSYADLTESILTEKTTGGTTFSYVETKDNAGTPDENPTLSPPLECQAISFEATTGAKAHLGGILRDMLHRWTDVDFDKIMEQSISHVVDAFRSLTMSIIINGEGADQADVKALVDRRFAAQAPLGTARFSGSVFLVPLLGLMREPGQGYETPIADLNLGGDCQIGSRIRETGTILNVFGARYKPRESGRFEKELEIGPTTDFECERSRAFYGRREAPVVDLHDVDNGNSATAILNYKRNVHLWPWYETQIDCPLSMSYILPGQKVRIRHGREPEIATTCTRFRHNLDHGTDWRDGIVIKITYTTTGLVFTVIF